MNYLMKAKLSQDSKEELFEDTKLEFNPRLMWCDLNGPNGLPYKYLYNYVVFSVKFLMYSAHFFWWAKVIQKNAFYFRISTLFDKDIIAPSL